MRMNSWALALVLGLALPGLSVAQPAAAREAQVAAPATADAERLEETVSLRWTGLKMPVSVWTLPTPDAPRAKGRRVARDVMGEGVTLVEAAWPRPYYLLRDAAGRELRLAERLLPLEGGSNFRDLGGYRTADGRQMVAWGQLYRSAVMSGLTPDDFGHLGRLGIRTVCDFRATDERRQAPVTWPAGVQPTVIATDYGLDMGAFAAMFSGGTPTAERVRTGMAGFYRETPFVFAGQYAAMFRELVEGRAPLAFNCSAGKDRTGVGAALLLMVLGVPAETAMADYLLSNRYYRPKPPEPGAAADPTAAMFARMPAEALQALMGVDASYLQASLAAIEEKGGMARYIRDDLKLSDADVATLRRRYLVPAG